MVYVDFVRFVEAVLRIRIQIWSDPKLFAGSGISLKSFKLKKKISSYYKQIYISSKFQE